MLLSVLTSNLEVSLNLTEKDIKILSDVDFMLLKAAMKVSSKASGCLLLLELGICSIKFILKKKRLSFLYSLLASENSSLSRAVWDRQVKSPSKNDWCELVKKDLKELNINLSFDDIENMSKSAFRNLINNACKKACFQSLLLEKSKLSKGSEIVFSTFQTQNYLNPGNGLTIEEMRRIYHLRCRQVFLKCNFPSFFGDKKCVAPHQAFDRQKHVFYCSFFSSKNEIASPNIKYDDIFASNVKNQIEVMRIFYERLERRKGYLSPSNNGAPVDPIRGPDQRPRPRYGIREATRKNRYIDNKRKTKQDVSKDNPQ